MTERTWLTFGNWLRLTWRGRSFRIVRLTAILGISDLVLWSLVLALSMVGPFRVTLHGRAKETIDHLFWLGLSSICIEQSDSVCSGPYSNGRCVCHDDANHKKRP